MPYDYSKLAGRIREKLGTQREFARAIGLSERSVSLKMTGEIGWKQKEIADACKALELSVEDIAVYFFTLKVQY